ncbi:hypothetical protein TSAR_016934 [Trichomalopsis sarcophagae]|uniref:Uncharacterized protein n=1 Tax=Trichomalopsis sarcophagae TaxID=543379 RepID=A0A232EZQ7_9HYME|nr:hypothetical protein TSAR_016934 [Trichomalopsis sarcophagae]
MSRANQRAPIHDSLSARTLSQSDTSKKCGPNELQERVTARTSGKSASSLPTVDGVRLRARKLPCSPSFVDPKSKCYWKHLPSLTWS